MSTQQCKLCLHRKLAILWIFFSGAIVSSSVVKTSGQSDFQNSDDGTYIMRSYFDNYENLDDSSFENFMAHELSSGLCRITPENQNRGVRLSALELFLVGEGSHRQLSVYQIADWGRSIPELPSHICEVIVIQRLPLGNNGMEINILLPLHARYQPLNESGYSIVEIGEPDMFMRCSMEGKQSCLLMSLEDSAKSRISTVKWKIPAGIKAHTGFVPVGTFITASLSTVLIVYASMFWSGTKT
ncbi:Syntaxin/t-SNARE family protein [Hibiscus syriacus]|uniref:Syntaxin/t-SNARE family protein n=1 Tax=Hibiscus syriacus TaxID=106335 RepID=A0A6A3CAE5_HIBSY|nr:Syntaxin/t-SNARE family protein [Hibiscus syriacus]